MTTTWMMGLGRFLCPVLCMAFAPPVLAQTPTMILIGRGAGGSANAYFLADTFRQIDARTRSAEIVLSYDKPRFGMTADYKDDPEQRFMSFKSTYYVHCAEGLMATAYDRQYSEPMGAGMVVGKINSDAPPQEAWYRKPTDIYPAYPIETTTVKKICEYQPH